MAVSAPGRTGLGGFARRPATLVFLIATALSLVVTFPVILHFNQSIYGSPGDATGGVTQFWWWGYALLHGRSVFDNTLEGVPLGSGWDQIPFVVLPVLVFTPLSALIGPIASYNLLVLSGFPLTAWAMYLFVRKLGYSQLACAFSGLAFAFAPYHVEKAQGHAYQTHLEFVALALYFLVARNQTGRMRYAAFAGVTVGLELWMDYSVFYVLGFGLAVFFVVSLLFAERTVPFTQWLKQNVTAGVIMSAVTALFVPLMLVFAHRPGSGGSLSGAIGSVHRDIGQLQVYSARIYEYALPWHANPLLPNAIRAWENAHLHDSNWTESSLAVGYTVMALAVVGLLLNRVRFPTALAIALVLVGAALAEPPMAHLFGIPIKAPSYYLYQVVTFFRVYARFVILVLLGAMILAAAGLTALQSRLKPGRQQLLLVIPFLLLAIEFNNLPPTHTYAILPAPAEYTWLAAQPPGILIEYPAQSSVVQTQEVQVRQYELYQMVHLHPTFLNEAATDGPVADAALQLEPYYAPGVADQLRNYGVRYVFVHRDDYVADGWDLPENVPGLTYVTTINGVDIYTVS